MDDAALVASATQLAERAHAGQTDKIGEPYIGHPLRVAARVDTTEAKVAALLHDVLEDTDCITRDGIRSQFGDVVADAVVALTHPKTEADESYYARVKANPLALKVKLADIADNTDPDRAVRLDPVKAAELAAKYEHALALLRA